MNKLSEQQAHLCDTNTSDFSSLKATLINCSLKKAKGDSKTQLLLDVVEKILTTNKISCQNVYLAEHPVAFGVYPDMTEHGHAQDAWPKLWPDIYAADILIIGTPIWLGEESSLCRLLIERLYGMSGQLNEKGQSSYYGKVGGVVVTGNEDGIKHCAMSILYALSHLGYTIPPQADCGWIGEAGPGPSYGDQLPDGSIAGYDNDFTQRNTTIMTWNLMHLALMLKQQGGINHHGNDRRAWKAGCRFDFENPGHRN